MRIVVARHFDRVNYSTMRDSDRREDDHWGMEEHIPFPVGLDD